MGGGWESHGAPFNKDIITGVTELVQKQSRPTSMWLPTPDGLSQSNIGIKGRETITPGLDFVFDLNFGFNSYAFTAANGPQSLFDNNGIALAKQSSNADSSRAGQFYNAVGYAGFSSPTYGTLTFGRQNSLELDGVNAYDPMGGSYAFSVIGWQGTAVGGGDTEDARISTAIKYRVDVGNNLFRLGGHLSDRRLREQQRHPRRMGSPDRQGLRLRRVWQALGRCDLHRRQGRHEKPHRSVLRKTSPFQARSRQRSPTTTA